MEKLDIETKPRAHRDPCSKCEAENVEMFMTSEPSCVDRVGCKLREEKLLSAAFEPGMMFKPKYRSGDEVIVLVKRVPHDGPIYYNLPCWEVLVGESQEILSDRFLLRDCRRLVVPFVSP